MAELRQKAAFRIIIRKVERPFSGVISDDLDWICESLGFFGPGPRENAATVFKVIVRATENGQGLTSTEIANRLEMSRGSAINHLNNLMKSGLISKHGRHYLARSRSVYRTIEEIEDEVDLLFNRIKKAARQIDSEMGFDTLR
jgi:predicted transcriptional regulator